MTFYMTLVWNFMTFLWHFMGFYAFYAIMTLETTCRDLSRKKNSWHTKPASPPQELPPLKKVQVRTSEN